MKKLLVSVDLNGKIVQLLYEDDTEALAQFRVESGDVGLYVQEIELIPKDLKDHMDFLDLLDDKYNARGETLLGNTLMLAQLVSNAI